MTDRWFIRDGVYVHDAEGCHVATFTDDRCAAEAVEAHNSGRHRPRHTAATMTAPDGHNTTIPTTWP